MFWIPIIGPIIQGIVSIFTKVEDTKLGKYKVDGSVDIEGMQASEQIIHDTNDDIALRIMRDMACFPVVVWTMFMGWDTIIAKTSWKVYQWHLPDYPEPVRYIPYVILAFLFGNIGFSVWKRK